MTKTVSARLAGVSEDTLHNWLSADASFSADFEKASAIAEARLIVTITKCAIGSTKFRS